MTPRFFPMSRRRSCPARIFIPADMTKAEFEAWVKTLDKPERESAESFFTVIRRNADKHLHAVPYNLEYEKDLPRPRAFLDEAASLTTNASLKKFLTLRAAAFRSNNYYESDLAWMDLDAPIDITIGPVRNLQRRDCSATRPRLKPMSICATRPKPTSSSSFRDHLQEVENNLPIDRQISQPEAWAARRPSAW